MFVTQGQCVFHSSHFRILGGEPSDAVICYYQQNCKEVLNGWAGGEDQTPSHSSHCCSSSHHCCASEAGRNVSISCCCDHHISPMAQILRSFELSKAHVPFLVAGAKANIRGSTSGASEWTFHSLVMRNHLPNALTNWTKPNSSYFMKTWTSPCWQSEVAIVWVICVCCTEMLPGGTLSPLGLVPWGLSCQPLRPSSHCVPLVTERPAGTSAPLPQQGSIPIHKGWTQHPSPSRGNPGQKQKSRRASPQSPPPAMLRTLPRRLPIPLRCAALFGTRFAHTAAALRAGSRLGRHCWPLPAAHGETREWRPQRGKRRGVGGWGTAVPYAVPGQHRRSSAGCQPLATRLLLPLEEDFCSYSTLATQGNFCDASVLWTTPLYLSS